LSLSLAALAGCGQPAAPAPIRIGVIAPYSGEYRENGLDTSNAAELAISEVNARGGLLVGGQRRLVTLVYGDDQDSPENAVTVAKRLINQDKVVALVGVPFSRIAIPVASVAEEARIPLISSTSTNPETTRNKRYVFRATFTDPFQGRVLARFARADLKAGRAAVLYDEASEYNRGIAEIFRQVFTEQGGSVVAFETYITGATDWGAQLERIKASNPDVLLLPNYYTEVPGQAKQARALGITAPLLGGDGWDVAAMAHLPELEGSFITLNWHPDVANEQASVFIKAYQQSYNKKPSDIHANTYDAFGLLFQAIERAGSADPDAIRDQLATTTAYHGVTGEITFSGSGDPVKSAVIIAIDDGKDHFYQTIDP
jgi:branched-chain amino acid transport system substrate-binding protein